MREEDVLKLFTPFPDIEVAGDNNRTGLGLSITKGIIDLHGGTITAESAGLGQGSRFSFTLPVTPKQKPSKPQ